MKKLTIIIQFQHIAYNYQDYRKRNKSEVNKRVHKPCFTINTQTAK